jgi:hypothetical protein
VAGFEKQEGGENRLKEFIEKVKWEFFVEVYK